MLVLKQQCRCLEMPVCWLVMPEVFCALLETEPDFVAPPGQVVPSRPSDGREKDACRQWIARLSFAATVPQDCTKHVNGRAQDTGGSLKMKMLTLVKA
jgi:hypothetical protein